jgi:hypothetical protein
VIELSERLFDQEVKRFTTWCRGGSTFPSGHVNLENDDFPMGATFVGVK